MAKILRLHPWLTLNLKKSNKAIVLSHNSYYYLSYIQYYKFDILIISCIFLFAALPLFLYMKHLYQETSPDTIVYMIIQKKKKK